MKKVVALIIAMIVAYSIYYDVTVGTLLPFSVETSIVEAEQPSPNADFTIINIKPGDTVISILEEMEQGPLPIPINQLVSDFKELNNGIKPEEIQIGNSYKFPIYKMEEG